jgi:divalent metal cation (Fe/Co/Zn/Cd) transporter
MDKGEKVELCRKALNLEYFTVGYNIVEGVVCISAGAIAGSIALVSFGLDSFIESFSGTILIWRLKNHSDNEEKERELERKSVKLVAYSFFVLAVYVSYESLRKLYLAEAPEGSLFGIIISLVSILIMYSLARRKKELGERMNSRALIADSRETVACICFSITLILGLLLNYFFGWWWADPVASLVIAGLLVREGREFWEEEKILEAEN